MSFSFLASAQLEQTQNLYFFKKFIILFSSDALYYFWTFYSSKNPGEKYNVLDKKY